MNADIVRRVRSLHRANPYHPLGIQHAVQIARDEKREPPPAYAFLDKVENGPCEVTGQIGPLRVRVRVVPDTDSRLGEDDVTGTFTDTESDTTVKNTRRDWGTDYAFYEPSTLRRAQTREEYTKLGMSKAVAEDAMRFDIDQDMAADASRTYHGVIVTISVDGHDLAQTSLWSIDTMDTIDGYDGRGYVIDVAEELITEALNEAKAARPETVAAAYEHAAKLAAAMNDFPELG